MQDMSKRQPQRVQIKACPLRRQNRCLGLDTASASLGLAVESQGSVQRPNMYMRAGLAVRFSPYRSWMVNRTPPIASRTYVAKSFRLGTTPIDAGQPKAAIKSWRQQLTRKWMIVRPRPGLGSNLNQSLGFREAIRHLIG